MLFITIHHKSFDAFGRQIEWIVAARRCATMAEPVPNRDVEMGEDRQKMSCCQLAKLKQNIIIDLKAKDHQLRANCCPQR